MTGAQGTAGDVPMDEMVEALRDVARLGGFFALDADSGPARGEVRLTPEAFEVRARAVNERYGTAEARIGVSIAHLGLAARLWSPVLACALVHGIVPLMTTVEWAGEGSALRLAGPRGNRAPRPVPALAHAVAAQADGVLQRLESHLPGRMAPRLLAGNSASALVGSAAQLLRYRPGLRAPVTELTRELLETGRLPGTGRITGPGLTFRRRSCCLYYRAPNGSKCGDCCLAR
ncbi:(2Fe-2S)-binding protein [Streptomyces sp. OfavH-34-F]|uniref:(2Fe-2S)-binding protein n=1 Tax=Streptomyces sp. OfavH-34-F TaxID=2917760 RepID=UPI001EF22E4D|nr:(2Fe-2S)-binding protein [Streptomyces sp. OfavH-34-F]MCG7523049.1 (2Fe-2S)-binding protein [Streptomyces sp. OfavH-34-F]